MSLEENLVHKTCYAVKMSKKIKNDQLREVKQACLPGWVIVEGWFHALVKYVENPNSIHQNVGD